MDVLESQIAARGYNVVNPWRISDSEQFEAIATIKDLAKRKRAFQKLNIRVASANEEAIRNCDIVLAVLDGADVDSGTASEVGFAYALGKTILGYRGDFRRTGENEGCIVNLQVEYWIKNSGGCLATELTSLWDELVKFSSSATQTLAKKSKRRDGNR